VTDLDRLAALAEQFRKNGVGRQELAEAVPELIQRVRRAEELLREWVSADRASVYQYRVAAGTGLVGRTDQHLRALEAEPIHEGRPASRAPRDLAPVTNAEWDHSEDPVA
jgi:hypothetical protein